MKRICKKLFYSFLAVTAVVFLPILLLNIAFEWLSEKVMKYEDWILLNLIDNWE